MDRRTHNIVINQHLASFFVLWHLTLQTMLLETDPVHLVDHNFPLHRDSTQWEHEVFSDNK